MSGGNVEVVRRAYALFNGEAFAEGTDLDLSLFSPDVEIDRTDAPLDGAVYRGHDGLRELMSLAREMWHRQRLEPQDFTPVGDDRVVVSTRVVSIGRQGVETVAQAASVWTVRDGRVSRMQTFQTEAEALEAAGVRD